ncbi:myo-inositol-1(or 4)-monophosphatase [Brevinema andersonii]|uniref:Inositol-1-monophosphatase n=1 Tax=Brevinema andersonii TaxID=34097 RepID=A0A1I1EXT9_BREAD|nr:inositol monophosphatase family protein [Brevinema andersonii]SFB91556.1 myo-inositol-1(or 4)-monophosphatase [Brevinema andersonii]
MPQHHLKNENLETNKEFQRYLDVARIAALEGGRILKNGFKADKRVEWKGDIDPVTEFDRAAELVIRKTISAHFPDHEILGEEGGFESGKSKVRWIVDPIDGTANFTRKIPLVAVTIGVEVNNELAVGVVNNPIMDEEFYAAKNMGAFFNGERIFVSELQSLKKAYVGFGLRREKEYREPMLAATEKLLSEVRTIRRLGCAALSLAYIACGRIDGLSEICLKPWDMAGGALILKEAGGQLANLNGSPFDLYEPTVLAGSPQFLEYLISVFKDVKITFPNQDFKN